MTFIDNSAEKPTHLQVIIFISLSTAYLFCTFFACVRARQFMLYQSISIRLLIPIACLILALENAVLASSGPIITNKMDDKWWLKILFVLQAFVIPILLLKLFEMTYLVHKRRSVYFCGMYFDEGRRVNQNQKITTPMKSFAARNFVRTIALLLWVMGILVNLDILMNVTKENELAGRTGWYYLWTHLNEWTEGTTHVLLFLMPTACFALCCLYLSITLWRYGAESSMVVYATYLNPWIYPFFGTVGLIAGQCFSTKWYLISSNIGFLILVISILLLMSEIDKDMKQTAELNDFLGRVKDLGNKISVDNKNKEEAKDDEICNIENDHSENIELSYM